MPSQTNVLFQPLNPDKFFNITGDHDLKKGSRTPRAMGEVTYIMLHQTACRIGDNPARYNEVGAHIAVTPNGSIVYINDLRYQIYHGHGFNYYSVGIEIDGHFAGIEGDESTVWQGGPSTNDLGAEQIEGARNAVLWAMGELVALGAQPTYLVAHRQGSADRQGDPGSAIWESVALWCLDNLDLKSRFWETSGTGMPLPRQWDIGSFFGWSGGLDKVGVAMFQWICNRRLGSGLSIDGVMGPKTRIAIKNLVDNLQVDIAAGFPPTLDNKFIEKIVGMPEYITLVAQLSELVVMYGIGAHLRGEHLFDTFESLNRIE